MKRKNDELIVRTLLYSDIFDYPLKESEVKNYLLGKEDSGFSKRLKDINSVVYRKGEYLFMKDREYLVEKRIKKLKASNKKLKIALKRIEKLSLIPTILLIGISGSLSMKNSEKDDDIDLFIVVKKNTVWITRLMTILFLKSAGLHRARKDKKFADKFCINMLVEEGKLKLPRRLRNLYTAHEVIQLLPVVEREDAYINFIKSNSWILNYLPNSMEIAQARIVKKRNSRVTKVSLLFLRIFFLEALAKHFQLFQIRKRMTKETIEEGFLAFHPRGAGNQILSKYKQKLVEYNFT